MTKVAKKPARRLMPKRDVLRVVGDTTFTTIWELMRRGEFPLPVVVGGLSYWLSWEIEEWIAALPRRKYKPAPDQPQNADEESPDAGEERKSAQRKVLDVVSSKRKEGDVSYDEEKRVYPKEKGAYLEEEGEGAGGDFVADGG